MRTWLRVALVSWLAGAPASAAQADERALVFPSVWRVEGHVRLSGAVDDGVGFLHPALPLHANVMLDATARRFAVSLWRPNELWLLQVGALASDRRGQPRLEPDDVFESGVAALVCAELAHPPPCDAPAGTLAIEVAESSARVRIERGVLRVSGRLRLVILDPGRPSLRIRVGVAYEGRGEEPAAGGAVRSERQADPEGRTPTLLALDVPGPLGRLR